MEILKQIDDLKFISAIKPEEGKLVYDFVIEQKPRFIIETGMGKSTLYWLAGINQSRLACHLTSVDLCEEDGDHNYDNRMHSTGDAIKSIFDEDFIKNFLWQPIKMDSIKFIKKIPDHLHLDVFMHDSKHTIEHLRQELHAIEIFKPEWFLCHDCIHDFAKINFSQEWFKKRWKHYKQARHLAIFKRK